MDVLLSILTIFFVALLLATAVTFGFALLIWFVAVGMVVAAGVMIRQWWRRWYFLRNAAPREEPPKVIDGDYEDISQQ